MNETTRVDNLPQNDYQVIRDTGTLLYKTLLGATFRALLWALFGTGIGGFTGVLLFKIALASGWLGTIGWTLFYALLGFLLGYLSKLTLVAEETVTGMENTFNRLVTPFIGDIMQRLAVGDKQITVERLQQVLDSRLVAWSLEAKGFGRLTGWLLGKLVWAVRAIFLGDFVDSLKNQQRTHFTVAELERFSREKLLSLLLDSIREQFALVRWLGFIVVGVLAATPAAILLLTR